MPRKGAASTSFPPPEQEASLCFFSYKSDSCLPSCWRLTTSSLSRLIAPTLILGWGRGIPLPFFLRHGTGSHNIPMILAKEILFRIPSSLHEVVPILSYLLWICSSQFGASLGVLRLHQNVHFNVLATTHLLFSILSSNYYFLSGGG